MTTFRRCWTFDRADRLAELAARARAMGHAIYRERCDLPRDDSAGRAKLAARIAANERRFRLLSNCARIVRYARRVALTEALTIE